MANTPPQDAPVNLSAVEAAKLVSWMPRRAEHLGVRTYESVSEVLTTARELVILGTPICDDEGHNCDANGCGQEHVLYRTALSAVPAKEAGETNNG